MASAKAFYQDEDNRTRTAQVRTLGQDPGVRRQTSTNGQDLQVLKDKFPFLTEFSDSFLANTPLADLLKMGTTEMKLSVMDKGKDADDRLSSNKMALASTFTTVDSGKDNRWNTLHSARYLAGAGVSATKMWINARKAIGLRGHPPIGNYDMTSIGLAGLVTAKGWIELHDPSSTKLKLKMFNVNKVSSNKSSEDDFFELADLKIAMRAMKAATSYVMPWNKSIDALDGFLHQNNFCNLETGHLEKRAQLLTQFIDYVLGQNAERWRDEEPFLTCGDLKTAWSAFFGVRSQTATRKKDKDHHKRLGTEKPKRRPDGLCWAYNDGKCPKAAADCKTSGGKPLRHVCNFVVDKSKPEDICGKDHMRYKSH